MVSLIVSFKMHILNKAVFLNDGVPPNSVDKNTTQHFGAETRDSALITTKTTKGT